jgi:hypothetical protein
MPKLLSKQESGLGSLSSKYWKTEEERNLPIEAKEGLRSRTGLKLVEGVLGCDQNKMEAHWTVHHLETSNKSRGLPNPKGRKDFVFLNCPFSRKCSGLKVSGAAYSLGTL